MAVVDIVDVSSCASAPCAPSLHLPRPGNAQNDIYRRFEGLPNKGSRVRALRRGAGEAGQPSNAIATGTQAARSRTIVGRSCSHAPRSRGIADARRLACGRVTSKPQDCLGVCRDLARARARVCLRHRCSGSEAVEQNYYHRSMYSHERLRDKVLAGGRWTASETARHVRTYSG